MISEHFSTNKPQIFVAYSRADEEVRKQLETSLAVLRRQRQIDLWYDRLITPGKEWRNEIDEHLASAQIILLLVSPDFINSDYCYGVEMKRAMECHRAGTARVIPIIVRPTDWEKTPFGALQALPRDGQAVSTWDDEDLALLDISRGIRSVVDELRELPNSAADPSRQQPVPPSETQAHAVSRKSLLQELGGMKGIFELRGNRKDLAFVEQLLDGFCNIIMTKYGVPRSAPERPKQYRSFEGLLTGFTESKQRLESAPSFIQDLSVELEHNGWSILGLREVIDTIGGALERQDTSEATLYLVEKRLLSLYSLCRDLVTAQSDESVAELEKVLSHGEDEHTEFKSTLRYNLETRQLDKKMEMAVLKAVAGLMNHDGGMLYVGVDDKGQVLGIKPDLSTLKKKNEDGFRTHFDNIFSQHIGPEHRSLLEVGFVSVNDDKVFTVTIKPADRPVFIRDGNDEKLRVRLGNMTKTFNTRQAIEYFMIRWPGRTRADDYGD